MSLGLLLQGSLLKDAMFWSYSASLTDSIDLLMDEKLPVGPAVSTALELILQVYLKEEDFAVSFFSLLDTSLFGGSMDGLSNSESGRVK